MKNYILWAVEELKKQGYDLCFPFYHMVQEAPWSEVYRLSTKQGNIYLKKTPLDLAIESDVIKLLTEKFNISTPAIIAKNKQEHCFLMKDAGISLRSFFKENSFNQAVFIKTLNDYTELQIKSTEFTQGF